MDDELRPAKIALGVGGACSLVLTVLLNAHTADTRAFEGPRQLALTAVCLVPLALAAGALTGRRILLLAAAIVAFGIGPSLWSGLPLMWIPAIAYAIAHARTRGPLPRWWRSILAVVVPLALAIAGLVLVFSGNVERCGHNTYSSYSDFCATVPRSSHVTASIVCALLAVVAGWLLGSPQRRPAISPGNPQVVGLVPHRQTQAE